MDQGITISASYSLAAPTFGRFRAAARHDPRKKEKGLYVRWTSVDSAKPGFDSVAERAAGFSILDHPNQTGEILVREVGNEERVLGADQCLQGFLDLIISFKFKFKRTIYALECANPQSSDNCRSC